MSLCGVHLVRVLDLINHHHQFISRLFTSEYHSTPRLPRPCQEVCNKLRALVSRDIQVLFVADPIKHNDRIKQRVWQQIHSRIGCLISSPFRFGNITQHLHFSLDDHVRPLLSEHVRTVLPQNFQVGNYGLPPHFNQQGAGRNPGRPQTGGSSFCGHIGDLVYSPTARATISTPMRVVEIYHNSVHGNLRRPALAHSSTGIAESDTFHSFPYSDFDSTDTSIGLETSSESSMMDTDSDTSTDGDISMDEEDSDGVPPRINDDDCLCPRRDCSLCNVIRMINFKVATARIGVGGGAGGPGNLAQILEESRCQFETSWFGIQTNEHKAMKRNYHPDPDRQYYMPLQVAEDERGWRPITAGLLDFLARRERESKTTFKIPPRLQPENIWPCGARFHALTPWSPPEGEDVLMDITNMEDEEETDLMELDEPVLTLHRETAGRYDHHLPPFNMNGRPPLRLMR
ncbi:hypothetical protein F4677DRAFT_91881 [Hypoxylon crocopeplum]|nr:hypothetical protein F4677DRAFT_91881 [Hypoxylon crocopeplum]